MPHVDIDRIAELLREVAAAEIVPRFQALAKGDVSEKKGGELVTVADVAAERALERRLTDLFPGSLVVGEEAVFERAELIEHLRDPQPVWVIDPIDGTRNFTRGVPNFGVQLALVRSGQTQAAWIYAPMLRRLATCERGSGALLDGRRRQLLPADRPAAELRGTLHAGATFASPEMQRRIQQRRSRVAAQKSKAAASIEYLRLLEGEMEFSLFTKLMPWDHAPGCLLLQEAGGVARFTDTRADYTPLRYEGQGLLLAPDVESWERLYDVLFGD
ncbi:MAG TPA: inositol monophosphatase family protein [Kiloniellales bacterium]|nr:inositol monophosphatase family protein [Kiloniellales bacterium]